MIITLPLVTSSETLREARKQLKNDYVRVRQELDHNIAEVKLTFSEPTPLHIDNRSSHDVTATEHTVRGLFFINNGVSNCEGDINAEVDMVCYTPTRRRTSGFPLSLQHLVSVELVAKTAVNSDYSKQWQSIADSMKKYGINPKVVEAIENHLSGKTEHIEGFQNYWKRTDKPKTLSFADVLQQVTGWPEMESGKSYPHKEWQAIHSNHIKEFAIPRMKSRAGKNEPTSPYASYKQTKYGPKRDRSVSIQVYDDGRVDYHAASEYAGCGNGDYYMMYSPTMAFYAESD